jgi:hypothetical protein
MNSSPFVTSFYAAFYEGPPVYILPQSIRFDTSAPIATIQISLDPTMDASLEGLSYSTIGL